MKRSTVFFLGLMISGFLLAAAPRASAEDRYARLRHVEGDVALYPYDKDRPAEAIVNSPVMDGDELETQNGRAEVSFRNGIVLRLGDYSAVRFDSTYSPMTINLLQGTAFIDSHMVTRFGDELELRAGSTQVFLINEGNLRVDMGKQGSVRVTTLDGEAEVRANGTRVLLETNERTYVDPGSAPESPESFARNYDELDDWNQTRIDAYARNDYNDGGDRYVDDSLYYDSYDLDSYGDWRSYGSYGNVWIPHVSAGWRPYYDGRWSYVGGNYFWISNEPWGWAPYHYGRWGWGLDLGWYWIPGYTFAPAWVSWYDYGDYIGWCSLNYYGYPNYYDDYYYGGGYGGSTVQKQKTIGVGDSWTFVKKEAIGSSSIKKISASGSDLKNIQIDKSKVLKQPDKSISKFVSGKNVNTAKDVKPSEKSTTSTSSQKSVETWTMPGKDRSLEDRDFADRRSGSSSTKQSTVTSGKPVDGKSQGTGSSVKGSSNSSGSSGTSVKKGSSSSSGSTSSSGSSSSKKSSSSSSSSSSGSSVSKKPTPPNYNRDEQYQKYLPGSTKLFNDSSSPSERDREFNTQSYRERDTNYGDYRSLKSDRGDGENRQWFRDPRAYDDADRGSNEVSPRYMDGARKFFERYEATRNTESAREGSYDSGKSTYSSPGGSSSGSGSSGSPTKSYSGSSSGSSSGKSYGGSSTKSYGGGSSGKSHSSGSSKSSSSKGSSSSSAKKPH